ncbi:MAG: SLC13 family permease, partial [Eubacterium sp.]
MNIAAISLVVFLATVLVGIFTKVNCGIVAMISSVLLVVFCLPDMSLTDIYTKGWPSKIFFMMLAVTLLFGMAGANGTMAHIARALIRLLKGKSRVLPFFIFLLTFILSATGAGPGVAPMIMPIAMGICEETGMSAIMMGVMIEAGAGAGGMSPIATNGIIASGFAEQAGATNYMGMWISYVIIMTIEAAAIYFIRGGYKAENLSADSLKEEMPKMTGAQKLTTGVIVCVIASVILLKVDVAMAAMAGAAVLMIFGVMKDRQALAVVNWNTLMLVAGMFMLITIVTKCGGIDLISKELMKLITPRTGTGVMALLSGLLATVTSSSGVVMPTLIPVCGSIAKQMGHGVT